MSFLDDITGDGSSSAQQYLQQALQQYTNLQTPSIQSEQVEGLPQETVQGTITPEQIQAINQAPSAYNGVTENGTDANAQNNALAGYQDIANSGGLDAEARLGIQQAVDAANVQSQGAQGAIQQQAQAMGQGGGDFALTQRAIAAQGASNNAATQGLQEAAEAEANREGALASLGSLGGSMQQQNLNQQDTAAGAQNTINATNQGYANAANTGNVANNLTAQGANVANAQGVNAANVTANQNNAYYNASLPQQQFNNELAKANGAAGVNKSQASTAANAASTNAAGLGKLVGAAGTIGGAAVGGPTGAAIGGAIGNTVATPHTTSTIASTPGYQTNAANNAPPGYAHGGAVCYAKGGFAAPHNHAICMKMGGPVIASTPEQKAEVPGDSLRNDKIPADLSEGELVIPRSVPKTGPAMEAFARNAPVAGEPKKKIDLTSFTKGYKRGK